MVEDDMPRRVPGTMDHVEREVADGHRISVFQPAIRLKAFGLHAPFAAIIIQLRDPEAIVLMRAFNGHAQLLGEDARLPAMVEMPVRHEQLFNRYALFGGGPHQQRQVATRIGKGPAHGLCTPDEAAILLQRGDRNNGGLKRWFLSHSPVLRKRP